MTETKKESDRHKWVDTEPICLTLPCKQLAKLKLLAARTSAAADNVKVTVQDIIRFCIDDYLRVAEEKIKRENGELIK